MPLTLVVSAVVYEDKLSNILTGTRILNEIVREGLGDLSLAYRAKLLVRSWLPYAYTETYVAPHASVSTSREDIHGRVLMPLRRFGLSVRLAA